MNDDGVPQRHDLQRVEIAEQTNRAKKSTQGQQGWIFTPGRLFQLKENRDAQDNLNNSAEKDDFRNRHVVNEFDRYVH